MGAVSLEASGGALVTCFNLIYHVLWYAFILSDCVASNAFVFIVINVARRLCWRFFACLLAGNTVVWRALVLELTIAALHASTLLVDAGAATANQRVWNPLLFNLVQRDIYERHASGGLAFFFAFAVIAPWAVYMAMGAQEFNAIRNHNFRRIKLASSSYVCAALPAAPMSRAGVRITPVMRCLPCVCAAAFWLQVRPPRGTVRTQRAALLIVHACERTHATASTKCNPRCIVRAECSCRLVPCFQYLVFPLVAIFAPSGVAHDLSLLHASIFADSFLILVLPTVAVRAPPRAACASASSVCTPRTPRILHTLCYPALPVLASCRS
ncbi:hypothetical protein EON66_08485 [archaeon]|nr:MAG: hypothetical protein EON66_08485 [archaeon]